MYTVQTFFFISGRMLIRKRKHTKYEHKANSLLFLPLRLLTRLQIYFQLQLMSNNCAVVVATGAVNGTALISVSNKKRQKLDKQLVGCEMI